MRVNTDTDVPDHRANRFEVVVGKLFATCFAAEQDQASHFTAHDHRQHELDAFRCELVAMSIHESYLRLDVFLTEQFAMLAAEETIASRRRRSQSHSNI